MTLPSADDDGLPGFNGLAMNGCAPDVILQTLEAEPWGWWPISDAVEVSNLTVEGTITGISEPRFTTLSAGSRPQFYFRVVDIEVDRSDPHIDGLDIPPTVRMTLNGAGLGVDPKNLCYGGDGYQDERALPLEIGSRVIALGDFGKSAIAGFEDDVLFLPRAQNTFWQVKNGIAVSVQPEYSIDPSGLWNRLQQEVQAKRDGRPLEVQDAFSVAPIRPEPTRPTTPLMVPPGIDAGTTPTSQP